MQHLATRSTKRGFVIAVWLVMFILCVPGSSRACYLVSDLSGDCRVDMADLLTVASQWMGSSCGGETGLVAHWKLNESVGPTAADASGSGYNGMLAGDASWNPSGGILGGALEFDGINDYVWITQGYSGIMASNPRTCTAWIKTDQASGSIMSWGNLSVETNGWVIGLDDTGVLRIDVGGGFTLGTTVLNDDCWHHIGVVSDGTSTDQIILYVDGRIEQIGQDIISQSINTQNTSTVKLGAYTATGSYLTGLIDDARIYNRTLSAKQIWSLATMGTTKYSCADLNSDEIVNLVDLARLSSNWDDQTPIILINEFLADNESDWPLENGEILDGNYESSDWIELYNNSQMAVDVSGWYLTDDSTNATKWQFPNNPDELTLQPGDYLLIFASAKTQAANPGNYPYADSAGYLHTNFQLSNNGEYLGLIASDGVTPVHEYKHFNAGGGELGYPGQEAGISYGTYYNELRYFSVPTPGIANHDSFSGFTEKPALSAKGGCYVNALDVTISCSTPGAFIRYTTDGTVPSLTNGIDYNAPVHIENLTTLIVKSFKAGLYPSEALTQTYVFLEPEVAGFNSNLPIVVIDTVGRWIDSGRTVYTPCRAVIIDVDQNTGRTVITGDSDFAGWGGIRPRGQSTYLVERSQFAFEIHDEYGQDKDVSILGMPADSDWIINGMPWDYSMMRDCLVDNWFRRMGHYSVRERYVEVYINMNGGKIKPGDYRGLYTFREKIKRGNDRVDIARLDASHNLEPKVSGGYIIKRDKMPQDKEIMTFVPDISGSRVGSNFDAARIEFVDPEGYELTANQKNWLKAYVDDFETALYGGNFDPVSGYAQYIDVDSWIDDFLMLQYGRGPDALVLSHFMYKDRGGKLFAGPVWDYNGAFGEHQFESQGCEAMMSSAYGWQYPGNTLPAIWYLELNKDPGYRLKLADRWYEHRRNTLTTSCVLADIDENVNLISEAVDRTLYVKNWWGGDIYPPSTYWTYEGEIDCLKQWVTARLNWMDDQIAIDYAAKPPVFSLGSGYVAAGMTLTMSNAPGSTGNIFYTLNGSDPRLDNGSVSPAAQIFSEGDSYSQDLVSMGSSVWKFLYNGLNQGIAWRTIGFDDNGWNSGAGQLGFGDGDEVTNIGPQINGRRTAYFRHIFNLSDVATITALSINLRHDDGSVVYLNGQEVGRINMPDGTIAFDTLANIQGENSISTFSGISPAILNEGNNILAVEVHQMYDNSSDLSFDLRLTATRLSSVSPIVLDKSTCVKARVLDGNNWGAINMAVYAVTPVAENLRITELMYHPSDPNTEFVELQNVGSEAINLNLVHISDGVEFTFGDTTLSPGQFILIVEDQAAFDLRYGTGLNVVGCYEGKLDNAGERITLSDALGNSIQSFEYEDNWHELTDGFGYSLTVVNPFETDLGAWDRKSGWRASLSEGGTPGGIDSTLAADSIVINELLAHSHGAASDWIELYNKTAQNMNIGGWFLSDDNTNPDTMRKFEIPAGTVINAHSYLVFTEATSFGSASLPEGKGFGFSEGGETLYLYSGQDGQVTGYYQTQQKFDASETDITCGRYEKPELSAGYDFVRMAQDTPGQVNSGPLISPLVITEIHYNPTAGADYEYVELYNRSGVPLALMTTVSTETSPGSFITEQLPWRLEGTGFEFPAGVMISPGQRILVAKNPALYPSAPCDVYGPYEGKLDNAGERIEIRIPGDQEYGQARYQIPIEIVEYDDADPWPTSPDGMGDSLQCTDVNAYANDYSKWNAVMPTPGT